MEKDIKGWCEKCTGLSFEKIEQLPASGSARKYFRLTAGERSYMATYHEDVEENRLFIRFSRHFKAKGLAVPEIYHVTADEKCYLQEDLGDTMLLDVVEQQRKGEQLPASVLNLYRQALVELVRFQVIGHEGLDYSACIPRPVFDRQSMAWDLNYFKYCFLRLAGVGFSEQLLEEDFTCLLDHLVKVSTDNFMFRDFQSRNIMVKEGKVWFIDYQGGRQGALPYDVASLLYDAIARIPKEQREELLEDYLSALEAFRSVGRKVFRQDYYRFVLIRLLQAMGAFGLRGLHEGKQHFIDSIVPGLQHILTLFQEEKFPETYPEIERVCRKALAKFSSRS